VKVAVSRHTGKLIFVQNRGKDSKLTFTYFRLTFTTFTKTYLFMTETVETPRKKHIGRNLQRIRVYLGVKQEALAIDTGLSQQSISKLEQQDDIEDEPLRKIAEVLGVSPELIKDFDEEKAVYNINSNNYREATIHEGGSAIAAAQVFNPVEKIVELYERLLKSEREKIELLTNK
jgi:transcriptional regulator with XRE-family HTH domain